MGPTRAIGLDIGTSSLSAIVMDGKTGELLETLTRPNHSNLISGHVWENIQDPAVISDQIEKMLFELELKHAPVACVGLTGQMHGIVYVDDAGNAVSPLYTWQDGRGNLEYQAGLSYGDYLSYVSGYRLATGFGAVTHFYNSVNGLVPRSARYFCTIHDFVAMKLTRATRPLLHPTNAASLGFYEVKENRFDRQAIKAAGIDEALFPAVSPEIEVIGTTGSETPVAITLGDNQASFIGSVNDREDCLLINIGTSGQITRFVTGYLSSQIEIRPFTKGDFLLVGSSLCGGRAYALLEKFFRSVVHMATGVTPPVLYDIMNELASDISGLENKLEISTKFSGTREHPGQRGTISNIGIDNFTPRHFIVGVLEGVVKELYSLYEIMSPQIAQPPRKLVGSGNAIRLCAPLPKLVSEVFGLPLSIPRYQEEAGYGAALFALVAVGAVKSLADAQALVQYL